MDGPPSGINNKTVTFDVGGKIYRVSRSLLDQHPDTMLARYASDTWFPKGENNDETDTSSPLFIERNGERFQYVLDYMRDGVLDIPITVSKDAMIRDLSYFGLIFSEPPVSTVHPNESALNVSRLTTPNNIHENPELENSFETSTTHDDIFTHTFYFFYGVYFLAFVYKFCNLPEDKKAWCVFILFYTLIVGAWCFYALKCLPIDHTQQR